MQTETWHLWERLLAGEPIEPFEVANILETPTEYQLRRLLRSLPDRDELFERFSHWLLRPVRDHDEASLIGLARSGAAELAASAAATGASDTFEPSPLEVVLTSDGWPPLASERVDESIMESLLERVDAERTSATLRALWDIAYATSADSSVALHLCAPAMRMAVALPSWLELAKVGRTLAIGEQIWVSPPEFAPRPGHRDWESTLDWPTDDEIATHRRDELLALDSTTSSDLVRELCRSESPFIRAELALHPNLDEVSMSLLVVDSDPTVRGRLASNPATTPGLVAQLARDEDDWVRSRAVASADASTAVIGAGDEESTMVFRAAVTNAPGSAELFERAMHHPDSIVRQNLAQRSDLPLDVIEHLADDSEVYVRSKIADNPLTPEAVLERLRQDEHRLVRRRAQR